MWLSGASFKFAKMASPSYHWNVTSSRHDIAEQLLVLNMKHSLTHIIWSWLNTELNCTEIRIIVIYYKTFQRMWCSSRIRQYVRSIWFEIDVIMIVSCWIKMIFQFMILLWNLHAVPSSIYIRVYALWICMRGRQCLVGVHALTVIVIWVFSFHKRSKFNFIVYCSIYIGKSWIMFVVCVFSITWRWILTSPSQTIEHA